MGSVHTEKFAGFYAEQAVLHGGTNVEAHHKPLQDYEKIQHIKSGRANSGRPLSTLPVSLLTDGLAHMLHRFLGVLGANIGMAFFGVIDGFF